MGYETEIWSIKLSEPTRIELAIQLKSKPIEAPKITVTAKRPRDWKKNLKEF